LSLKKRLLSAKNPLKQLEQIIDTIGPAPPNFLNEIRSDKEKDNEKERTFVEERGHGAHNKLTQMLCELDGNLADLVSWMLQWNPEDQPTASEALNHCFFAQIRDQGIRCHF
jgi:serine/threonine protein kinase